MGLNPALNLMDGEFELPPCPQPAPALGVTRQVAPGTLPPGGFTFDPQSTRFKRLRRRLTVACNGIQEWCDMQSRFMGRAAYRALFITLTYAKNTRGSPNDIKGMLKCLREWLRRGHHPMVPYAWVAELQGRGALHYHLMVWLPHRMYLPTLDKCGWWKHGATKVETARSSVGYMVKYAGKFETKDGKRLRRGTRLYGTGGLPPKLGRTCGGR